MGRRDGAGSPNDSLLCDDLACRRPHCQMCRFLSRRQPHRYRGQQPERKTVERGQRQRNPFGGSQNWHSGRILPRWLPNRHGRRWHDTKCSCCPIPFSKAQPARPSKGPNPTTTATHSPTPSSEFVAFRVPIAVKSLKQNMNLPEESASAPSAASPFRSRLLARPTPRSTPRTSQWARATLPRAEHSGGLAGVASVPTRSSDPPKSVP